MFTTRNERDVQKCLYQHQASKRKLKLKLNKAYPEVNLCVPRPEMYCVLLSDENLL